MNNNGKLNKQFIDKKEEWFIPSECLTTLVEEDDSGLLLSDYNIKWFHYNTKNQVSESEEEKKEKQLAMKEQFDKGIISLSDNDINSLISQQKQNNSGKINPYLAKLVQENTIDKRNNNIKKPKKIGPNDKCPCGSGKKFKKCHGRGKGFIKI